MSEHEDASLDSRIRGLALGLALGDAVGSRASDVPLGGVLQAGAATQLAAWTIEGTLRNVTRYGRLHAHLTDIGRYAYQRWAFLRGLAPANRGDWAPFFWPEGSPEHARVRGWLVDDPAMSQVRGTSPSTRKALVTGSAVSSAGCQAMLRVLPVAPMALIQHDYDGGRPDPNTARVAAQEWARNLALLTHDDGQRQNASVLAIQVLVSCLTARDDTRLAIKRATDDFEVAVNADIHGALRQGIQAPCVPQTLERLAPHKTSWSALAGGLYVALSFPDEDTITEAIEFAGWAPDGDSVAAVAGAILGARHGYEALPLSWVSRLELGWVMDRLAIDLAAEVREHQGGTAWKDDFGEVPAIDPWWGTKYPGV
jgi:ADP-ribosylglycohydrolase